jgi:signal transduction histidine kinase
VPTVPRSVRSRTALLATVAVALALIAVSAALLAVLEASLVRSRDDLSRGRLSELVAQVRAGSVPDVVTDVGEDGMGQVVGQGGQVLAASDGLTGRPAVVRPVTGDVPVLVELRDVPDDGETEDYRAWVRTVATPDGTVTAVVGVSPEAVEEATTALRTALLIGAPLVLVAVAAGTRLVVGRSLRPVEDLRREVAEISAHELSRRVPVPPTGDEIARLAGTMNEVLARLDAAGARQREFVGDASHELRTPLTALRAQLEVALAHPGSTSWEPLARELLEDVTGMELLVGDLLQLAREDAGPVTPERTLVDLDEVVLAEIERLRSRTGATGPHLDATGVSAGPVRGSSEELARAVRNLLDNAAEHAATTVRVTLTGDDDTVTLVVADDGPGVPEAERERVFERFTRLQPDRARGQVTTLRRSGSGLGLAIVRGVVRRHGGSVVVDRSDLGGAALVVRLPALPPTRPS